MKRKAARRTVAKKAPKKEKTAKKAAKKKVEKKKAPAKKRTKKAAEPVAVQEVGPAGSEIVSNAVFSGELMIREPLRNGPLSSETILSGSIVHDEVGAGMARGNQPGIDLAGAPVIHAPVDDGYVLAEAGDNGAVSEELANDIEEDLRLGREFMKKYRETFRALAK